MGVLELTNLFFLFKFIKFHSSRDVIAVCGVFRMEHMSTQIKNGFFIMRLLITLTNLLDAKCFNKLADVVYKVAHLDAGGESFF